MSPRSGSRTALIGSRESGPQCYSLAAPASYDAHPRLLAGSIVVGFRVVEICSIESAKYFLQIRYHHLVRRARDDVWPIRGPAFETLRTSLKPYESFIGI